MIDLSGVRLFSSCCVGVLASSSRGLLPWARSADDDPPFSFPSSIRTTGLPGGVICSCSAAMPANALAAAADDLVTLLNRENSCFLWFGVGKARYFVLFWMGGFLIYKEVFDVIGWRLAG